MDGDPYQNDPDRVRPLLRETPPGDWFVFETVAADGGLAVGLAQGPPDPGLVLVVYRGLTQPVAAAAARGLARWHRRHGRNIAQPHP